MTTHRITRPFLLTAAAAFLAGPALEASADTIAYCRFEDSPGFLEDSSANNRDLTETIDAQVSQSAIPGSGNGSDSPNFVPQNGLANNDLASLTLGDGSSLMAADDDAFTDPSFSVEGFFNPAGGSIDASQKVLVSHFNNVGNQRSWAFYVQGSDLRFLISDNG